MLHIPNRFGKNWDPRLHYRDGTVARDYDRVRFSGLAGRCFNALERSIVRRIFSGLPPDLLVLDAPCGTGRLAESLLEAGHRVVGADISAEMLAVARERLARFGDRFIPIQANIEDLPDQGRSYDAVLCARFLMHFPLEDQVRYLAALNRVTTGPVVFNQSLSTPYQRARRRVKKLLRHQTPAAFPLTPGQVRYVVAAAGLRLTERRMVLPLVSEAAFFVCRQEVS